MLTEDNDIHNHTTLHNSLTQWSLNTQNTFSSTPYEKETGSLYRYGWFYINNYKYSISGWNLKTGIVTFEIEATNEKIKFDINQDGEVSTKFPKDNTITVLEKNIKSKISKWLRNMSDKLQS